MNNHETLTEEEFEQYCLRVYEIFADTDLDAQNVSGIISCCLLQVLTLNFDPEDGEKLLKMQMQMYKLMCSNCEESENE